MPLPSSPCCSGRFATCSVAHRRPQWRQSGPTRRSETCGVTSNHTGLPPRTAPAPSDSPVPDDSASKCLRAKRADGCCAWWRNPPGRQHGPAQPRSRPTSDCPDAKRDSRGPSRSRRSVRADFGSFVQPSLLFFVQRFRGVFVQRSGGWGHTSLLWSASHRWRVSAPSEDRHAARSPGSSDGPLPLAKGWSHQAGERHVVPSPARRIRSASGPPGRSVPPAGGPRRSPETTSPRWRIRPGASRHHFGRPRATISSRRSRTSSRPTLITKARDL